MSWRRASAVLATACLVTACGQKGALYLPSKANVVTRPAAAPLGNAFAPNAAPAAEHAAAPAAGPAATERKPNNTVPPPTAYPDTAAPATGAPATPPQEPPR